MAILESEPEPPGVKTSEKKSLLDSKAFNVSNLRTDLDDPAGIVNVSVRSCRLGNQ